MNRNDKIAIGVIAVFVVVGGVLLFINQQQQTPPSDRGVCKTYEGTEHCTGDYSGLTEAEAVKKAEDAGLNARVVARDGETFPVTQDYSEYRLNFTIESNKVTKAEFY